MNEDPRMKNQLFEIERTLLQKKQKNQSKSGEVSAAKPAERSEIGKVLAMAFDFDETINLHYNGYTYGASFDYNNEEQPDDAANVDSPKHVAFEIGAEPVSFEVESFGTDNYNYHPPSTDFIPAIPVEENNTTIPLKSAHPIDVASGFSTASAFDEDEDVQAFAADLQAILKGEKTYEPETKQLQPAEQHNTPNQSPTQAPPNANQMSKATSHAVFDQVAEMNFANSFELGTLALEQRFDEFDRLLDKENNPQTISNEASVNTWSNPFVVPPHLVNQFATTNIKTYKSFDISYEVPLIPQQTGVSAWAAAAAMLVAWRDQVTVNLTEIAQATGNWAKYKSGLQAEDPSIFKVWGLVAVPAKQYTVEDFKKLMMNIPGPLLVASAEPGSHVRVVTGLVGDGTPNGTIVHINDPRAVGMTSFQMPNAGAKYTETYSQFVQKQPTLSQKKTSSQGIYIAHLQEPIGLAMALDDDDD
jgi:Papain-like cysteine protease AvrRpt2